MYGLSSKSSTKSKIEIEVKLLFLLMITGALIGKGLKTWGERVLIEEVEEVLEIGDSMLREV